MLGSGDPVSVQSHIIKVSVLHFNFQWIPYITASCTNRRRRLRLQRRRCAMWCVFCFQMFENIKSLRLETNLNGTIVIKGMLSTESEFLPFQDEGSYTVNSSLVRQTYI